MRVLLIEKSSRALEALVANMVADAIRVEVAHTGDDALFLLRDFEFDLVMLNLVLPDVEGSSLIRQMRTAKHDTPIIALSSMPQARLKALAAGADDVVTRDVDPGELNARIRAVVRRSRGFYQSKLHLGCLTLDINQREAVANGIQVQFTAKEFAVLELLVLRRNRVLSKDTILSQIYGGLDEPDIKIVDVFVCKIRSKLSKAGLPTVISTVWGRGYCVKDIEQEAPDASLPLSPLTRATYIAA